MKNTLRLLLLALAFTIYQQGIAEPKNQAIRKNLAQNWRQLPEKAIAHETKSHVFAQYTVPTRQYAHGILGDDIEARQLVVVVNGSFYEHTLSKHYVFEDIRPRLYDIDNDGHVEFITIRSHQSKGAGIVIYKLRRGQLIEYATLSEIQKPYRWLNIVTINDLDNDGIVELVWIQTPHIGGIVKVAKITPGRLRVLDEKQGYSNHAIGQRNLCLSVLRDQPQQKTFFVATQDRSRIVGFSFTNNTLNLVESIDQAVDFSQPLNLQYGFENLIDERVNCITSD